VQHTTVRFVHASDLHLERPVGGLTEAPDHLRQILVDAPYLAAQRVFDCAVAEAVDFVILAGDVVDAARAGARALAFLDEQFGRLAQHGIRVYWAGGNAEQPEQWSDMLQAWPNVHLFPAGQVERLVHRRSDTAVACLLGTSRHKRQPVRLAQFCPDPDGLPSIGVLYGCPATPAVLRRGMCYLALGGRHQRGDLPMTEQPPTAGSVANGQRQRAAQAEKQDNRGKPSRIFKMQLSNAQLSMAHRPAVLAHFPGTPQGRCAEHLGPHGCTLVETDGQRTRTRFMPTDAVRWIDARLTIDETTTRQRLEELLREQVQAMRQSAPAVDLLVCWRIIGDGQIVGQLRSGPLAEELLAWLRLEFGYGPPACWSVSIQTEPDRSALAKASEEQTVLGDLLRALQQLEQHPQQPLELESMVEQRLLPPKVFQLLCKPGHRRRTQLLQEAAELAIKLLGTQAPGADGTSAEVASA
jgi:exonuclease SbcD